MMGSFIIIYIDNDIITDILYIKYKYNIFELKG